MMARKIFRIISWSLLGVTLVCIFLILRNPTVPTVETSPEAAKSFDRKILELEESHRQDTPREIRITEAELNSKLREGLEESPGAGGTSTIRAATVRFEGERIMAVLTVNVGGKDVYLTLGGRLGVRDQTLEFTPSNVRMGSLPIPRILVESALRDKLNAPEMREHMKLPDAIKDIHVENGELVMQSP